MRLTIMQILIVITLLLCGCVQNNTTVDIQKIIGKSMIISNKFTAHIQDRDTSFDDSDGEVKLITYYNFRGCSSCKLKELSNWKTMLNELDSVVGVQNYKPIFILNVGIKEEKTIVDLIVYDFTRPVLFDREGAFEAANLLPEDPALHTFLVDKHGKVRLVGSPIGNPKMWELYKKTIKQLSSQTWIKANNDKCLVK